MTTIRSSRWTGLLLPLFWAAWATALSVEAQVPASAPAVKTVPAATPEPQAIPLVTEPPPVAKPVRAETPPAAAAAPAAPARGTETKSDAKAADRTPHIALVMPLNSRALGKVADAVKQGFLIGAAAEGRNAPPFRVYPAEDEAAQLSVQYRKAVSEGAAAIIGGLTRDGAQALAREVSFVPTLALNAPGTGSDIELPDRFFYISLSLDAEARLAARAATDEGFRRAAVITTGSPLARRVLEAFEREWSRLGGEVAARIPAGADFAEGPRVAATLEKAQADVVFLAAESRAARTARPFLPTGMPVFATSMTVDPRADAVENLDLDAVRFMEMPWFVQPDHPAVMAYSRPLEAMPIENERLYALGIDAWRLARAILKAEKTIPPLDGVTGRITLEGRQFVRQPAAGEMRDGRPALYKPAAE